MGLGALMLPYILPFVPPHKVYTEAFFGGGAVFWAKEKAKVEIINDFNANVYTFYKVLQSDFSALKVLIEQSVVSKDAYKSALVIYHTPFIFSDIHYSINICNHLFLLTILTEFFTVNLDEYVIVEFFLTSIVVLTQLAFHHNFRDE